MKKEPLFIRYANSITDEVEIVRDFMLNTEDMKSKDIAKKTLESLPNLSIFKKDFKECLQDLIDNGISNHFINYVDSYMKPSLLENIESTNKSQAGEKRWVLLKDYDAPWIEALVCYNMSLYLKVFGIKELKRCPTCGNFFSNKGKYAKYCTEDCKKQGV